MHDLVIKGARMIDGLGNPEQQVSVAVRDGRIVEIGDITESAAETVDADGRVLSPGVIDSHTHYDAQLTWDSTASPSPSLGVTTVVIGNCGFGIAPCPPHLRETVASNLSVVEGMDLNALVTGIDWGFESFPEYMDFLRTKGVYPNTAVLAGHSVTRTAVMGKEGSERAEPTDSEMAAMKNAVKEALDAGAIGFASSFSPNHMGWKGVPMPSTIASDDEVRTLAGLMKGRGHGVFQMASGSRGTVEVMESIAKASGGPAFMTTSLTMYNEALPGRAHEILDACAAARGRGNHVYAQVTCQPFSMDFTPANPYPFYSHDAFADIKAAPPEVLAKAYADPSFRDKFRANLAAPKPGGIFYGDWNKVEITLPAEERNMGLLGQTVAQIAMAKGGDPVDAFCDSGFGRKSGDHRGWPFPERRRRGRRQYPQARVRSGFVVGCWGASDLHVRRRFCHLFPRSLGARSWNLRSGGGDPAIDQPPGGSLRHQGSGADCGWRARRSVDVRSGDRWDVRAYPGQRSSRRWNPHGARANRHRCCLGQRCEGVRRLRLCGVHQGAGACVG